MKELPEEPEEQKNAKPCQNKLQSIVREPLAASDPIR